MESREDKNNCFKQFASYLADGVGSEDIEDMHTPLSGRIPSSGPLTNQRTGRPRVQGTALNTSRTPST
ncbi:hypothetical protein K438DRAFT_2181814, partial [Mycena galopus ATCC 62051]